jgi:sec-independent protein translocase protein TatA
MFGLGSQELMVILVIALFLFGAQKLPELARGLGKSVKEFKKATEGGPDEPPASGAVRVSAPGSMPACAACQTPLRTAWAHCPRCGAPVAAPTPAAPVA